MILVGRTLLVLVIEFIIEYSLGIMLSKYLLKRESNPAVSILMGFVTYQILFQMMTIAVVLSTRVLHHLSIIWLIFLAILVPFSMIFARHTMMQQMKTLIEWSKQNKWVVGLFAFVMIGFCYYTSINGEQNDDACYYIGLMTTTLETDSLFRYNAYTGIEMESLYLRRALSTFEIHSAMLSQVTGIHPLLIARIFRACQNVVLTSLAVLLCSKELFWESDNNKIKKAMYTTAMFWLLQLPFANTIYMPATFLLYRTYEAKAFAANMMVLMGLYLCIKLLREENKRYLLLMLIFLWGSIALSTSAFVVTATECGVILLPVRVQKWITKKGWGNLHADS